MIVHTSAPVGDDAFTSDVFGPSFPLSFSHTTSESTSPGFNIDASLELMDGDMQFDFFVGMGLNNDAQVCFVGLGFVKHWR